MNLLKYTILLVVLFVSTIICQNQTVIFEGMGSKLISEIDAMTDEKNCAIFVEVLGPIYFAIYGSNDFTIWAKNNNFLFASDSKHLIRVGDNKPYELTTLDKRNGLKPLNKSEAKNVIEALLKGEEIKIRVYEWPSYSKEDISLINKNLSFVYDKAIKNCNWADLGIKPILAPVELKVYESDRPNSKGYATVSVIGNDDLSLAKGFDEYGGGCYIEVGIQKTFGMQKDEWCCDKVAIGGDSKIVLKSKDGKEVFSETVPENYSSQEDGNPWPIGEKAARLCYDLAPEGSIEVIEDGSVRYSASLYGFKELWDWGVTNGCLVSIKH